MSQSCLIVNKIVCENKSGAVVFTNSKHKLSFLWLRRQAILWRLHIYSLSNLFDMTAKKREKSVKTENQILKQIQSLINILKDCILHVK